MALKGGPSRLVCSLHALLMKDPGLLPQGPPSRPRPPCISDTHSQRRIMVAMGCVVEVESFVVLRPQPSVLFFLFFFLSGGGSIPNENVMASSTCCLYMREIEHPERPGRGKDPLFTEPNQKWMMKSPAMNSLASVCGEIAGKVKLAEGPINK